MAADDWVTLFGAPLTMQRLLTESPVFSRASSAELYRANGAVHASHLSPIDLQKIIRGHNGGECDTLLSRKVSETIAVYSTSSCSPLKAATLQDMLKEILHDILDRRLELTGTMDAAATSVPVGGEASILSIGASAALASFQKSLERRGAAVSIIDSVDLKPEHGVRGGSGKVAVVGVGGRFPGPDPSVTAFWQALLDGKEFHQRVPADRWKLDAWQHALGPDAELPYGCWLEKPGEFDARLFNISPREAAQMDPIHRLLMMATYEALESAGYAPEATPATDRRRISAFFGQSSDDWRDINHQHGIDTHYVPCIARAFGAGRLHHYFKFEGPAFTVDSACGSSAVAIATACTSLNNRGCDMAIAGGGLLCCSPDAFAGLVKGGFISPTGSCKTFRNDVDGYCRGEAVAMIVLKRLEDAEMDNDNILGVIESHARNHSAYASSITHPHQPSQERVFRQALHAASTLPSEIGYVEAHGTGTTAGDMCEVSAIANVLGQGRTSQDPLIMGAVKANVGHGESAAAIVAMVKALMVLKNGGTIPPQPGFKSNAQLNPELPPLEEKHIYVAHGPHRQLLPKQKILLNCFDATGGNTCMVLSRPPLRKKQAVVKKQRTHSLVVCSGHTFTTMKSNQRRLLDYVMANRSESIRHLAYTTTSRRLKHHMFRAAYVVKDMQELGLKLLEDQSNTDCTVRRASSIAFAFTGQGACYRSMGQGLFQTSARFRAGVESCQAICDMHYFPSVIGFFSSSNDDGADVAAYAAQEQLALVTMQIALSDMLKSWGVQPDLVIGHSIGEYASLYTAGVLSLSDTIYLVGKRAELLQQQCKPHDCSMLVVPMPATDVQALLHGGKDFSRTCVSCKNTPKATVCSGPGEEIERLRQILDHEKGISTSVLPVAYGFHSPQVENVAKDLERVANTVSFLDAKIPVASTLEGKVLGNFSSTYLARQTREAVDFQAAIEHCRSQGLIDEQTLWIEVGPDAVCTSMVRGCGVTRDSNRLLSTLSAKEPCWNTLHQVLASLYSHGRDVDWTAFFNQEDDAESLHMVELAPYAFDSTEYWRSYECDAPRIVSPGSVSPPPAMPLPCLTPFLHHCTQEPAIAEDGTSVTASFISRVSHTDMVAAARGHLVDGTPIFPGSAFCEMGYAAAEYVLPLLFGEEGALTSTSGLVLTQLDMHRPLVIATDADDAVVHTTATADDEGVEVVFSLAAGNERSNLGSVRISYSQDGALRAKAGPTSLFLVETRAQALIDSVKSGAGHSLRTSVVYRLFSRYIGYGSGFQGLREVWLNQDQTEAVASVKLVPSPASTGDRAARNCYWRDTVFHLAGYMLNGHPDAKPDDAYIAVAVEGIIFLEELNEDELYTVYTYMKPTATGAIGDVYVLLGEKLVALCADMVYKRVNLVRRGGQQQLPRPQQPLAAEARSSRPALLPKPSAAVKANVKKAPRAPPALSQAQIVAQVNPTKPQSKSPERKPTLATSSRQDRPDVAELIIQAVADETGWSYESIDDNTALADLGVDSLMTIVITSKLRSQKGVELASNKFRSCVTIRDVRTHFGNKPASTSPDVKVESIAVKEDPAPVRAPVIPEPTPGSVTPASIGSAFTTPPDSDDEKYEEARQVVECHNQKIDDDPTLSGEHSVEVFLIQGSPHDEDPTNTRPPLFLVPDGSGSITSFLALPQFPSGTCVYGLHSPWVENPDAFTCTIEQASRLYLEAVRAKQPHGPYIFGGWSAGCVFAYELARQLLEADEEVLGLIIIDMHVPKPLPQWIDTTKELWEFWCDATGLKDVFAPLPSGQGLEEHLIKNFRALNKYQPVPMKSGKQPKHGTFIIWATKGMGDVKKEDIGNIPDPLAIGEWFCFDRTDFGPRGWDELVGSEVECVPIEGNHRSIMVPPDVSNPMSSTCFICG